MVTTVVVVIAAAALTMVALVVMAAMIKVVAVIIVVALVTDCSRCSCFGYRSGCSSYILLRRETYILLGGQLL